MSAPLVSLRRTALLLRDVFAARTRRELCAAHAALMAHVRDGGPGEPPDDAEAARLEYAFNRLFIGPDKVPAPPYASVYLDGEGLHLGASTLEMRALLHSLGRTVPHGGQPDDFLPYELEAWHGLTCLLHDAAARPAARDALIWLCEEHLGRWLPVFLGRARQAAPPPMLGEVLNALEAWLAASLQRSLYEEA